MVIIVIIFFVLLAMENSKLKKENAELKKRLENNSLEQVQKTVVNNIVNDVVVSNPINNVSVTNINNKETNIVDNKKQSTQGSSAGLFIAGAILIVIASFIFIGSTWDLIPGLLKTIILFGFLLFFNLMSNICRDKYKLEKTSNVFYYLAMIFIPIILLSLSLFNVVGEYFSITGGGFLLYVGITFLISDLVYKFIPTNRKNLRKFAVVSEILAIINILNYLNFKFINMMFVLAIYNVIVYILMQGNYLKKEDYNILNNIFSYINILILIICTRYANIFANIGLILHSFLCFWKLFKAENKPFNLLLGVFCYTFGIEFICDFVNYNFYFIYLVMLLPLYALMFITDEKHKNILCYTICIISSLFVIINYFDIGINYYLSLSCFFTSVSYIISFIISKKHVFKYLTYLGFTTIMITLLLANDLTNYIKYIPLAVAVLIYGFEYIVSKLKDRCSIKVLVTILTYSSLILINDYAVLISLVLMIGIILLEKEKEWFLLVPILCSLSLMYVLDETIAEYLFLLVIVLLSMLSLMRKKLNVYSITSFIAIFMSLGIISYDKILFTLLLFIWGISHLLVNSKEKNIFYKLVTAFSGLALYIFILLELDVNLVSIYSIGFFVTLFYITRYIITNKILRIIISCYGFFMCSVVCLIFMTGEIDGFIEVIILLAIAMFFHKKYKSYFVMSVIFIVIYVLIETAEFLFMIPWYVYVLLIGFIFIIKGVKEENKKKNKDNNINMVENNASNIELSNVKESIKSEKE